MNILLADDDIDDCQFFRKALEELHSSDHLTVVPDGEQLMNYLHINQDALPEILFLDLSMPRKTGFECLSEIKNDEKLAALTVVMFSTAFPKDKVYEENVINLLMKIGAYDFIRKPGDFKILKNNIHEILLRVNAKKLSL